MHMAEYMKCLNKILRTTGEKYYNLYIIIKNGQIV